MMPQQPPGQPEEKERVKYELHDKFLVLEQTMKTGGVDRAHHVGIQAHFLNLPLLFASLPADVGLTTAKSKVSKVSS